MGHGSFCTNNPDTWEIELANAALGASELLDGIRPDLERPVRYRMFSCWVFDTWEEYLLCEHGPLMEVDGQPVYEEPDCPPGMEDYPYSATGNDLLDPADQARMLFGEALQRVWADLELNVEALGPAGEPVHGTVLITSLWVATCDSGDFPMCDPLAGRAVSPTANEVHRRGTAIVTDEPSLTSMWLTLAHETGHTIGLVHDDFPGGFMNEDSGTENGLGISVDPEFPNADNNSRWEAALLGSKGQAPRSSGFYLTGCAGPAECAPLGKPGWSCSGLFCIEDSP